MDRGVGWGVGGASRRIERSEGESEGSVPQMRAFVHRERIQGGHGGRQCRQEGISGSVGAHAAACLAGERTCGYVREVFGEGA